MDKDFHIFTRHFIKRAHPKSLFSVEVLPGVIATFGESKSKFRSKRYQLAQLKINKQLYKTEVAEAFWKRFHVKYIHHKYKGKKLPYIHRVIGSPRKLIHDGYIIICEPTLDERVSFCHQQTYEYWLNKFELNSRISNDEQTLRNAIPVLLNKIATKPSILKQIPTTDWRVFEEIVAEVFRGFGYKVVLTKKTKDGGKDIIALQKDENGKVEKILIECKHWKDKVDVKPVREIIGVAVTEEELPTGVILATTNKFTSDAKKVKINPNISVKLDLKEYNDILNWIEDYNAIQFTPEEMSNVLLALGLT